MIQLLRIHLPDRAIVALSGDDCRGFLQDLITNDVERLTPETAIYAALLTPQGKYLHDFFAFQQGDAIWLDCEAARRDDLVRRLTRYRLRAKVTIDTVDEAVHALIGDGALAALGLDGPGAVVARDGGVVYGDPRLAALGARAVRTGDAAVTGFAAGTRADYDALRLGLGIPDGSRDLAVEEIFALEAGLEDLHGVDFEKGCYVGQEVTARMKHRALVRKRLVPVRIDGPMPAPGTEIRHGEVAAGKLRSVGDGRGIALLRLDRLGDDAILTADAATLTPEKPDWAVF